MNNEFMVALLKSMSSEELAELSYLVEAEYELRRISECNCGAGYCPDDNLTYPCVCQYQDELPF